MIVKEWLSTISFREFRTYMYNGNCWVAPSIRNQLDVYEDLFDTLKNVNASQKIKGKLSRIVLGGISVKLNTKEAQLNKIELLSLEDIASLSVEQHILKTKERTLDTLAFLLYEMTYCGKYLRTVERDEFIRREKIKIGLAPNKNILDKIADDLYVSYTNMGGLIITHMITYFVFLTVGGFSLKNFLWASLLGLFIFTILSWVGSRLYDFQMSKFKIMYKKNIEEHLALHPDDKSFLNTYEMDSLLYKFLF